MIQWLRDATHNLVVHPLMMFLPARLGTAMHDRNAAWAFGPERLDELDLEAKIKDGACPQCGRASIA